MDKKEFRGFCKSEFTHKKIDEIFPQMEEKFGIKTRTFNNWYYNGNIPRYWDTIQALYDENKKLRSDYIELLYRVEKLEDV